jgi:FdhD protein
MRNNGSTPRIYPGVLPLDYVSYNGHGEEAVRAAVIEEGLACIYVNGQEFVKFMCTPHNLDELALGFLRSEGIIQGLDDVEDITLAPNGLCLDMWLYNRAVILPTRVIITSGCGGGVTFDDLRRRRQPLNSNVALAPSQVLALMAKLRGAATLYKQARGVHTSALSDGHDLLLVAEDVGRHNTIDRIWGKAMKRGISTEGRVLLTTGRISSEMLGKAAKMGVPVMISRTSPTSLSVELATAWNMTVIGYARRQGFRVYAAAQRVVEMGLATTLSLPLSPG